MRKRNGKPTSAKLLPVQFSSLTATSHTAIGYRNALFALMERIDLREHSGIMTSDC